MGLSQPRVTVGMPVYNDPEGLRRSVPSIFGQTWRRELRLIIVDDGSTDDTAAVIASLRANYGGIELVRLPQNMGRPHARNRIVELAGDDYLAWCDSGDLWNPRKLDLQLATLLEAEQRHPGERLLCTGSIHWVQAETGETSLRVPEVDGDQLRNALLSRLYPYLQGLVGRAGHFRELGGFDERLLRRQDYDFLVRFLGSGGRLVAAPQHIPVFTYLKSYPQNSAEIVAGVNRIIRAKHRAYYRRYGLGFTCQVRSNQHRLVARFFDRDARTLHRRAHQVTAWVWNPDVTTLVQRLRRPRRTIAAGVRLSVRALRPLAPTLRRSRTITMLRQRGLDRIAARFDLRRAYESQVRGQSGRRAAPPPLPSRELDDASAQQFLEVERRYRENGLLHSAELALRGGLEQHPGDVALRGRLIEVLPLRRKWAECVDLWSERGPSDAESFRPLTYVRVARAYRQLGNPAEALNLAEDGRRRWPDHPGLREELYQSRAQVVDWRQAVGKPDDDHPLERATQDLGALSTLGSLGGDDGPVEGWISVLGPATARVSLLVNGTAVASTTPRPTPGGDTWTFALSCDDLRNYLGEGDVISIEYGGQPLAFDGGGAKYVVRTGYESRVAELQQKLRDGFVFTKFGQLKMGATAAAKAQTLALYDEVAEVLRSTRGYPVFPFYGNLLGAIREHDIISHDVGGFDMGYVSNHHEPEQVRAEFLDICRALLDRGYHLRLEPWSVYIRRHHYDRVFVDINYAWFTRSGELNFSFGWRHSPVTDRERFFYPRESLIGNHLVRVPGNAEQVLEQLYGPSWPVPDQGFALDAGLRRDSAFLLTPAEMLALERLDPDRVEARLDHFRANGGVTGPEQLAED
jgi:glycosyltransferase involved in cell wall biosynthesis